MNRAVIVLAALVLTTWSFTLAPLRTQQENGALDALLARINAIPGQANKPFSMIVRFKVKPDQVEAVLAAATKAVPASRAEKGCIAYDVQQSLDESTEFLVLETWRDAAALRFHSGTDHFSDFIKVIRAAAEGPPQMSLTKAVVPAN
jgi:quinol monooxygenase YgiN